MRKSPNRHDLALPVRGKRRRTSAARRVVVGSMMAFALTLTSAITGGAVANAWSPTHGTLQTVFCNSSAGMAPVKLEIQRAARGGSKYLLLLDGLRATNDVSGWDKETNAFQQFQNDNINVVMPVGGAATFYSDWVGPIGSGLGTMGSSGSSGSVGEAAGSSTNTGYKPMWETFLTKDMPNCLAGMGMSRTGNAIAGLSMGGSAALTLANYHRDQFNFAGSFSGYLNNSAPGMRQGIRLALLSQPPGYNVDNMWGPPWSDLWLRNDPFVFAPQLRGLSLYISAADGIPGPDTSIHSGLDVYNTVNAMGLEAMALANTRSFQARLWSLGIPATFDFPATGVHNWGNWQAELWKARPQILAAVGA
ncbi:esterase family protein [Rhodococcus sp. D2-41]|nr:esterase family protein [Rhodococcus sp. D2-41]